MQLIFANLAKDPKTAALYGEKERNQAINWFNNTQIPVLWDLRLAADKIPSISYSIQSCEQTEETLADAHYQIAEDVSPEWEAFTKKFNPNYIPVTGVMTVPIEAIQAPISEGAVLVTRTGAQYPILEVINVNQFVIARNLIVNLNDSYIKGNKPSLTSGVESCRFKEVLKIGCHVSGDPTSLIYLHSICFYILLKYRKTLLEARGFERSTISSGPYMRDDRFQMGADSCFSRFTNLVGYVTMNWSSKQVQKLESVATMADVNSSSITGTPVGFIGEPGNEDPEWLAADMVGAK